MLTDTALRNLKAKASRDGQEGLRRVRTRFLRTKDAIYRVKPKLHFPHVGSI